ncbi:MAG: tetratricopeptide repeat protein [Alphaproteobacteria bacterium]|nr:tetratricopeptide repeat protein [Alphaproteobacteria bacterium]
MKRLFAALIFILLAAPAVAQDFDKGLAAYNSGDYATALREMRPLAEQGSATAQFGLGNMYLEGHGVPQDYAEAAKWYRLAAEQGHADAQFSLGLMYANDEGVPRNDKEALKWLRLAADQGSGTAQFILGMRYAIGEGVPQDFVLAYMWLNLGGASPPSVVYLMTPSDISMAQRMAREWLEAHPQ